mmetsp:Transcript_27679/g.33669  ORF Transcript_27679/g.33669 Transcript_27679/m.33669 type:complete len:90 (-) Transcript_27679:7-276(-)
MSFSKIAPLQPGSEYFKKLEHARWLASSMKDTLRCVSPRLRFSPSDPSVNTVAVIRAMLTMIVLKNMIDSDNFYLNNVFTGNFCESEKV